MKETFAGKKDSVINITLLHPPQKLFGCWKLQPGQLGASPTRCPERWRCPKSLCKEGPSRSSLVSTSAMLLLFLLFLPFGWANSDGRLLGTPRAGCKGLGPRTSSPNWWLLHHLLLEPQPQSQPVLGTSPAGHPVRAQGSAGRAAAARETAPPRPSFPHARS